MLFGEKITGSFEVISSQTRGPDSTSLLFPMWHVSVMKKLIFTFKMLEFNTENAAMMCLWGKYSCYRVKYRCQSNFRQIRQKIEIVYSLMVFFFTFSLVTNFFTDSWHLPVECCISVTHTHTHTATSTVTYTPAACDEFWIINWVHSGDMWYIFQRLCCICTRLVHDCGEVPQSDCAFCFVAPLTEFNCLLLKYMLKLFSCAFSMQMTQLCFTDSMLPIPLHELVLLTWLNLYSINIKYILLSKALMCTSMWET